MQDAAPPGKYASIMASPEHSKGHALTVRASDRLLDVLGPDLEVAARLKGLALIELWREQLVSGGFAAEALGIRKWEFVQLLGRHGVAYLDQTEEELEQDLRASRMVSDQVWADRQSRTASA